MMVFFITAADDEALVFGTEDGFGSSRGIRRRDGLCCSCACRRQIRIYSILLFPISLLPWALGFAGRIMARLLPPAERCSLRSRRDWSEAARPIDGLHIACSRFPSSTCSCSWRHF
jgi:hypothetical protein